MGTSVLTLEKRCSACKRVKSVGDFGRNRSRPDGLQVACRPCTSARVQESKRRNGIPREDRVCCDCGAVINVRKDNATRLCRSCAGRRAGVIGGAWSALPPGEAQRRRAERRRADKMALRARRAEARYRVFVSGRCVACSEWFIRATFSDYSTEARYCSRGCRRKGRKRPPISPTQRRRVFVRDGWCCGICWGLIDPALAWPDPWCAVVDHVVPLAAGGAHDPSNWQAAHNRCNADKADAV